MMTPRATPSGQSIIEQWLTTEICSTAECGTVTHELEQRALLARLIDEALEAERVSAASLSLRGAIQLAVDFWRRLADRRATGEPLEQAIEQVLEGMMIERRST